MQIKFEFMQARQVVSSRLRRSFLRLRRSKNLRRLGASLSMKRLGVFLLPLDGMLVHRRSFPRNFLGFPTIHQYPFIDLGGERNSESKVPCPGTQQCPLPGARFSKAPQAFRAGKAKF